MNVFIILSILIVVIGVIIIVVTPSVLFKLNWKFLQNIFLNPDELCVLRVHLDSNF